MQKRGLWLVALLVGCGNGVSTGDEPDAAAPVAAPRFARDGAALVPLRESKLAIRIDADARGPVRLVDARSKLSLSARLVGAREAAPTFEGDAVVFADALGPGVELRRHVLAEGVEDFVTLPRPLAEPSLAWQLELGTEVAGLRLTADVLELLSRDGVPRLRVPPPWVRDVAGVRHAAKLAIEGCAVDTSTADPFGRAVVDPGARSCTLRIRWPAGLAHPLLVDPAWTATGNLITGRRALPATVLASGRVLLVGGNSDAASSGVLSTAELYDPGSGTFASAGAMAVTRADATATLLGSAKVLVAGGIVDTSMGAVHSSAELYDPATGWSSAGTMTAKRARHSATLLPSGNVLLVGSGSDADLADFRSTAEIYTPGAGFAATGSMAGLRNRHLATLLPGGKVLVAGGSFNGPSFTALSTAEIWDPGPGTWSATGSMATKRSEVVGGMLPSGKVLLALGRSTGGTYETTAELFDPATGSFTLTGSASDLHTAAGAFLPDGRFVVTGTDSSVLVQSTEVYAPSTGTWSKVSPSLNRRRHHVAVAVSGGRILVAAGVGGATYPLEAELFSTLATGTACVGAGECTTGFCADGVCCDAACTGTCQSCTAALKTAGADGACGPSKAGLTEAACTASSTATCGLDGTCDGAGACRKWVSGTTCVASSCAVTTQTNASLCDGLGTCVAKGTTACATGYGCAGIVCATTCASDANCAAGYWCSGTSCVPKLADGTACGAGNQCTSGFCADGVCCATKCDALCDACTKALKGSGADGTCGPVPAGDLGRGLCKDTSYCAEGACKAKKENGLAAAAGFECTSGIVADGVCCATACDGVCEACDIAGTKGTCAPVKGAPKHGTCPAAGADPCSASSCDGATRKTCALFAGPDVVCRPASCTGGVETAEAKCEGKGACPAETTRPCDPLVCDGTQCRKTCRSDTDCAPPNHCDEVTKSCVKGATCDGDHTVLSATGGKKDCAPLKCAGDRCLEQCNSSADCITGFACDTATKTCATATAGPTEDSGGCAMGPRGGARGAWLVAGLLAVGALRRRRR